MQFDRQITITTGASRNDLNWKPQLMTVAELYDRLRNPVRSTETLDAYMHLPKPQQDALKDVGGFVGGSLNGGRRKANAVTGRDLVTLDFDNIPGWGTDEIVSRVDAIGCSYAVYSTRKHCPNKPRLRVVIPLDRTATPDEYEPLARRLAWLIGIDKADPTTFQASRLMYWPSACVDSDYVFRCKDAPLASVDFLLGTYADWRNMAEWPQVPGRGPELPEDGTQAGRPHGQAWHRGRVLPAPMTSARRWTSFCLESIPRASWAARSGTPIRAAAQRAALSSTTMANSCTAITPPTPAPCSL